VRRRAFFILRMTDATVSTPVCAGNEVATIADVAHRGGARVIDSVETLEAWRGNERVGIFAVAVDGEDAASTRYPSPNIGGTSEEICRVQIKLGH